MLILRCDEATVYAVIAGVAALLSLFAALRAVVSLLSSLLSRVTRRLLHPVAERSLCAVVGVVVIVFFANGSALLPALLLLATVTSGAFCHSLRSFRWLWVCCFVAYGALLLHLVGPRLWEDVDVNAEEWSALVRGQRVLMPSRAAVNAAVTRSAAPGDRPASRFLFSYYDGVRLEGSTSPALADGSAPRRHVLPTEVRTWLQGTWVAQQWQQDSAGSTAHKKTRRQKGRRWKEDAVPTFHIIASGDGTVLTHYADREVDGHVAADSVYLVGQRSRLEHNHVHCRASSGNASSSSPCLRLHSTATLRNVTVFWTNATDADGAVWQSWHTAAESALTCAEVQQQLHAYVGQEDQLDHSSRGGDANDVQASRVAPFLLDCIDEFSVAQLPRPFVAAAPFPVRLAWHVPTYLHHAQEVVFVVADRIVVPLALFLADLVAICGAALSRLFGYFGAAFVEALPHVRHGAEQVAVFAGGVACGAAPRASGVGTAADAQATVLHAYAPAATRCAAFARSHATHAAFTAGVTTRNSVVAVCSAVADAADLFPGVWTVYRWAWDAEVRITVGILKVVRAVAVFVFVVLPRPLLHVVVVAAQQLGAVVKLGGGPLRAVGLWLARLPLLPYVSRLGWSLWAIEVRVLRYEWSLLQYVAEAAFKRGEAALEGLLQLLTYLVSKGSIFMTRYGRTSFSIHLVVTVLQSLLLLTAMRNEMRELVAAERLRSPTQRSPLRFLQRFLPGSGGFTSWLPLQSISAHVNGCVLLVRAHHQACVSYLFLHAVGLLVLIGLSVLPFMGKLYGLSLRYVLPWMSAKAFLVFFEDPPRLQATVLLVVARMALATTLQHTIGDFLYKIVKDVLIGCGLMGGLTLALWAWPQRTVLAQQVATAIADSLQGTPVPTPQRLAHGAAAATGAEPGDVEGGGSAAAAGASRESEADAVNKRIELSEET